MRMLLFADIHIGNIKDINYFYNTVTDIIEKEVMFKKTDAVIILGDYFDRLFKANEEYISLAINIMSYLIRACNRSKTKIRIVYGTESHEMNQYKLFNYHFTSSHVDIKLFTTVTEEELFPNVNVLYIPEEYIQDKYAFYKDTLYSGKKYDYIFGHGTIEDGMPAAVSFGVHKNSEKQVPRFKSGELSNAGKLTVFGHYHCYTDCGNNVYYLGSLFRHSFGEESPKGYGIIEDGKLEFVENDKAYVYKTYEFNPDSNIYNSSDDIMNEIKRVKDENPELFDGSNTGRVRLVFHTPANVDPSFRTNLKDILFNDKIISPLIKESNEELIEDAKEEAGDEYEFILDNSMNVTDKIFRFINKRYDDYQISIEELSKYINEPFSI